MKEKMRVYPDFPWVSHSEEGNTYELIDEIRDFYWKDENGKYEKVYPYGFYDFAFINPECICTIGDGCLYDLMGCLYPFCEITMKDGKKYYYPDYWEDYLEEWRNENGND